jgi:hypothetical protein
MNPNQFTDAAGAGMETITITDAATAKAAALFLGWTRAFRPVLEEHDVLEVESEFSFPLLNPETEAPSKTFLEAGKIDGVLRHKTSGIVKVLEHKTTSESIEPDSSYWPRLVMDTQISKYLLSLRSRGMDANQVVYDVIHKPAYKLGSVPLLDEDGLKIVQDQFGNRITTKDGKKWRQTGDTELGYAVLSRPETPQELFDRTFSEISQRPDRYYVQRDIASSDADLLEYMNDAWSQSQQILWFRRRNLWPRNPSACTQFSTCEFFELCSGRSTVDGIRFAEKPEKHAELEMKETTKELLTNSRLTALRKCSRLHYLRYESPTVRVGEQDEALALGTAFHHAAETFLKHFVVSK